MRHSLNSDFKYDLCIVGGGGHVGLPLGIVFADCGLNVLIFDINEKTLETIKNKKLPFLEEGAQPLLEKVLDEGRLHITNDAAKVSEAVNIVITIGTPVDEYLNPVYRVMTECLEQLLPFFSSDQLIILRSTVAPGVTQWVDRYLKDKGIKASLAFCPERVVQGFSVRELKSLSQIISGTTPEAIERAEALFRLIAPSIIRLEPTEAEFAKLMCNSYRYIQFAASNQFAMMAMHAGVDYSKVLAAVKDNYPRMKDLPGPGFAAGPCLHKDTMQLAACYRNQFGLGNEAMMINEGLPLFLIDQMSKKYEMEHLTVGILGMAFKANSDDIRSSLSYKLKKMLVPRVKRVLTSDPMVEVDPDLIPVDDLIHKSDVLVLGAPHKIFKNLDPCGKPVIDIWNFFGKGLTI